MTWRHGADLELENYSPEIRRSLGDAGVAVGDRIAVVRSGQTYEGMLLPRPQIGGDSACLVMKLDSGYNIGLKWDSSMEVRRLSAGRPLETFPSHELRARPGVPEISILATGGTISSRLDYETGGVKWRMEPGQVFYMAPEMQDLVSVRDVSSPFMVGSENMDAEHWKGIARSVAKELNSGASGAVVTHGTDMMHYSSAATALMLRDLGKPVVFTGSQRSTDRGSTDASMNLLCASVVAGHSDIAEVTLVMHGTMEDTYCLIHRGARVRKMHTSRRDAFRSINVLPLGKVWPDGKLRVEQDHAVRCDGEVRVDDAFEEKVSLLKFYPGMEPEIIDFLVDRGYRGILLEVTALGHVATDESRRNLLPSIERAIGEGVVIAAAPQTLYGRTDPLVYSEGRKVWNLGVIYCGDMLPETAYVKLGWVLGHDVDAERAREMMLTDFAGEISPVSDPRAFLV
jgi:glutamyl-tRNA(Gln) amidotransferase subunit D